MNESDLRLHLSRQTRRSIGLVDVLCLADADRARAKYDVLVRQGAEVILFDVLRREHEPIIGRVLCEQVREGSTLFVVGSSGVEYSLTAHWKHRGILPDPPVMRAETLDRAIVVSGSCSPVTDRQIAWALDCEFYESILLPQIMLDGFLGFEARGDGFALNPRLPKAWPSLTLTRIRFQGLTLNITVTSNTIGITTAGSADRVFSLYLPAGAWIRRINDQTAQAAAEELFELDSACEAIPIHLGGHLEIRLARQPRPGQ